MKKRFGKEDGTVAYHGYQSFAPGEATPELAHEIGDEARRPFVGRPLSGDCGDPP
ncbi:MAG: relaxase/mobilization nuclease domain-containing protein [Oscillospiraceae bacterium]